MKKRKGKRMLIGTAALLAGMISISPMTAFAVETEGDVLREEIATDEVQEEIIDDEAVGDEAEAVESVTDAGDDVYIDALSTEQDEIRSGQINMTAILPDELRLDLFADVRNVSTHTVYRLPLYFENGYTQRCYVDPGDYVVTNIGVYGDSTGKYDDFVYPEDFSLSSNETVDLFTMLADEESVRMEMDERLGNVPVSDDKANDDAWEWQTDKEEELTVPSDYEVTNSGIGGGKVGVEGDGSREYELIIRIVKGGIPGIMTVKYSLDGESGVWSDEVAVPLAGNIRLYEYSEGSEKDSGLTAYFSADPRDPERMFAEGDQYSAYIPDPATELVIRHKGDGAAALEVRELTRGTHAFHLLYEGGYAIRVEVLRGGTLGDAVVHISTDGGKSFQDQMYLPEDGIITLEDVGIALVFTGTDNSSLLVAGDTYSVDAVKENYLPLIIGVTAILLLAAGVSYGMFRRYMLRLLPSSSDYRIEPYIPYAEREKQCI